MTPYILFDYVPISSAPSAPALLAWFSKESPALYGLGVQPHLPFNPVPFLTVFPREADDLWVYAEWSSTLQDLLHEGISPTELHDWVKRSEMTAIKVRETGSSKNFQTIYNEIPSAIPAGPRVIVNGLAYLLRQARPNALVRKNVRLQSEAYVFAVDLVLFDEKKLPVAYFKVKRSTNRNWLVYATRSLKQDFIEIAQVDAPELPLRLSDWLVEADN